METKICSICGEKKSVSEFNNSKWRRGRLEKYSACKICQNRLRKEDRETKLPAPTQVENLLGEEWVPIKDISRKYMISNMGRIKSMPSKYNRDEKLMNQYQNPSGYLHVKLIHEGKERAKNLHRLVAKHFIENIENKAQVNHKNGVKTDNRIVNLEWCTPRENRMHALSALGVKASKGEDHYRAKLTSIFVMEIFESNERHKTLATKYGVSLTVIQSIKDGKTWDSVTGKKYTGRDKEKYIKNVVEIYNSNEKTRDLMSEYQMSRSMIKSIRRGETGKKFTGGNYIAPRKRKLIK